MPISTIRVTLAPIELYVSGLTTLEGETATFLTATEFNQRAAIVRVENGHVFKQRDSHFVLAEFRCVRSPVFSGIYDHRGAIAPYFSAHKIGLIGGGEGSGGASCGSGCEGRRGVWIPACAGMTTHRASGV